MELEDLDSECHRLVRTLLRVTSHLSAVSTVHCVQLPSCASGGFAFTCSLRSSVHDSFRLSGGQRRLRPVRSLGITLNHWAAGRSPERAAHEAAGRAVRLPLVNPVQ